MSDLQPKGIKVNFDGVEREFLFTLNVLDEVESYFEKPIIQVLKEIGEPSGGNAMRTVVTALVNDDIARWNYRHEDMREPVTEEYVGSFITRDYKGGNSTGIYVAMLQAYGISMPESEEEENPPKGRRKRSTSPA